MKSIACKTHTLFVESDSSLKNIGVHFRRALPGPEHDLIESFLQTMPLSLPKGHRMTVFREPRLESGFPDIVIVTWHEKITCGWRQERKSLKPFDFRVLQFLYNARNAKENELDTCFGRAATGSLGRLHDAGMIRSVKSSWIPFSLGKLFAATNIIAIEAKIGKWAKVLNQAVLNTWFASKSYVLVPKLPSQRQIDEAQRHGIGVCSFDKGDFKEVGGLSSGLPRSYASWMLNEWAWKSAHGLRDQPNEPKIASAS